MERSIWIFLNFFIRTREDLLSDLNLNLYDYLKKPSIIQKCNLQAF